mgnify:CR=1 FL=1
MAAEPPPLDIHVRPFTPGDRTRVAQLWEICGLTRPWNDPYRDIDRKLDRDAELLLVGEAPAREAADGTTTAGRVVAAVMAGYDGHRGWINYLAVDPDHWGEGYGRPSNRSPTSHAGRRTGPTHRSHRSVQAGENLADGSPSCDYVDR